MSKRTKFFCLDRGTSVELFQLETIPDNAWNLDSVPVCPNCAHPLVGVADIVQLGFWEDRFQTFFVCSPCGMAYEYAYILPSDPVEEVLKNA